ncbi:MAG: hypoxanthine phosphoribosyltransferase [Phycisphaerales bacterium JB060]
MEGDIERILIDRAAIARRVAEMGAQIATDLEIDSGSDRLVVVPVLTGALVFAADLVRTMPMRLRLELIQASSYPGKATSSQGVTLGSGPAEALSGAHVLIIDDIFDSGRTLAAVRDLVRASDPASVRTAVLLRKDVPRDVGMQPDYVGFDVPNAFVVGYGLDYDGWYRNLPNIAVLRQPA